MPSTKELRARIKSVSNTSKVTGAMQLIAASKMRRAQQQVLMGKKYAETIQSLLTNLSSSVDLEKVNIPLLDNREINNKLMILVTPDRGLAGALVGNVNKKAIEVIQKSTENYNILSVGRKGFRFLNSRDQNIVEQIEIPDKPEITDTLSISDFAIEGFLEGKWDQVDLVYSEFINTTSQIPKLQTILPISNEDEKEDVINDYIYEPSDYEVLIELTPKYVRSQVYQSILESFASEHSARMVAMQNATDNANELIGELTLDLNKARQETITAELLDLIGGISALEGK
ncbi:MAG: ATP synthase F1 subunit gamma [Dehalococcoidia bacterium]|jgi:F-type H+-transporting ATPase subunit gamma|nr:ATP synthase F1 subunit gamma [Chloroflexota bacterium]MBP05891.1 ATP synthase F1 subunit gamma [Chloroflexota bacterium]OUW95411.1 MAG: ATP synthase F1 subunit gamma [Chloroflexi bacterium TMED230]RZP13682.1 MAG: ATP synthase F1 subunit gamma [Chloroflexota bacterium]|tara:strand:- start:13714 stop:14574 length:861 start_codon:yes stop_codon:yes gene_type:complete